MWTSSAKQGRAPCEGDRLRAEKPNTLRAEVRAQAGRIDMPCSAATSDKTLCIVSVSSTLGENPHSWQRRIMLSYRARRIRSMEQHKGFSG